MAKKKNGKFKTFCKKHILRIALVVILIISLFFCVQSTIQDNTKGETISSSTLMKAIDIQELYTSKLEYNGIAEIYRENKEDVRCYIRYESTVKAGINCKKVDIDVDEENKIVYITLPKVKISEPNVDANSLSYIEKNSILDRKVIELKDVLSACKNDAKTEAKNSKELKNTAEENSKSIIEGLLKNLLESKGYEIKWKESSNDTTKEAD